MELRHLRYFLAVAETLNFRRAAEKLNISQPPLSTQIRQLEDELGVQLFERSNDGTFLTRPGRVFLDRVEAIMAGVESAIRDVRHAAGAKIGSLRVGWTASGDFITFLPQAIHQFRVEYPGVSITLNEMVSFRQIDAVANGEIDIGIARKPEKTLNEDLEVNEFWRDRLVVAVRSDNPLARRSSLSVEDLQGERIVAYTSDSGIGINHVLHEMCRRRGFSPQIVQECGSTFILGLVVAGVGVAVVPATLQTMQIQGLSLIPIHAPDAVCPLCTIHRRSNADPLLKVFRDTVVKFAREADPASAPAPRP